MSDSHLPKPGATPSPAVSHLRILHAVRAYELQLALAHFPTNRTDAGQKRTVLEIGAGTGQQAKLIHDMGYSILAIDLPSSHYHNDRVYDVVDYDGNTIPMADGTADVVFSSNVLEHVLEIDAFLEETRRVMTRDSVAIHILPSSACRLWSIPAHYVWLAKRLLALSRRHQSASQPAPPPRRPSSTREWLGTLFPLRHGERGTTLTETYYFSRLWWRRKFRQHGLEIIRVEPSGLFYTMANALAESLSIEARSKLSRLLGSSCHIYVLKRR